MDIKEMLLADETLFRDMNVFDPDYVPEEFLFRDAQLRELAYCLRPCMRGQKPLNAYLTGEPATGKTTAVRFLFNEFEGATEKAVVSHINCQMCSTPYRVFSEIHRKIFGFAPPDTGAPLARIHDKIFTRLSREKKALVVCLDDIDFFIKIDSVLYQILRAHEAHSRAKTGVWCISQKNRLHAFSDTTRSVFKPVPVEFSRYSRKDILAILKDRVNAGLKPGVIQESLLLKIAAAASDVRHAIELVRQGVLAAEADASRKVTDSHIDSAAGIATRRPVQVNDKEQQILDILGKKGELNAGTLYSHTKAMSYATFDRIIKRLESRGKISVTTSQRKGRRRIISLCVG